MRHLFFGILLMVLSSCQSKEEEVKEAPIEDIEVIEDVSGEVLEPMKVEESRYDDDGVVRLSLVRYYNAVVPRGANELYCTERGCVVEVDLKRVEVIAFFKKYFIYQNFIEYPKVNRFVLNRIEEDGGVEGDGGVVPNLGGVVERPLPGLSVKIEVRWDFERRAYLFEYFDPKYVEPSIYNNLFLFMDFVKMWKFRDQ